MFASLAVSVPSCELSHLARTHSSLPFLLPLLNLALSCVTRAPAIGVGKSVLAAALARDDRVRMRFKDGIHWVPCPDEPNGSGGATEHGLRALQVLRLNVCCVSHEVCFCY